MITPLTSNEVLAHNDACANLATATDLGVDANQAVGGTTTQDVPKTHKKLAQQVAPLEIHVLANTLDLTDTFIKAEIQDHEDNHDDDSSAMSLPALRTQPDDDEDKSSISSTSTPMECTKTTMIQWPWMK